MGPHAEPLLPRDVTANFVLPARERSWLETCERLLDFVPKSVRTADSEKAEELFIVMTLFYSATTTYQGAIELCRQGFSDQALMLNRALFEVMVDAHWAHANPDEANARYTDHAVFSNSKNHELMSRYSDLIREDLPQPVGSAFVSSDEERKRLERLYGRHGNKSWTGLSLHERVELIAPAWESEGERRFLRFFRDLAGRLSNETLHPSAAAIFRQVLPPSAERTEMPTVRLRQGPSLELFTQALFGAMWSYGQLLGRIVEEFNLPTREGMIEAYTNAYRLFYVPSEEDRRSTGRNDPCPCGSGRKFKHCHLR
jgi:uncharacterized protein YchJ